MRKPNSPQVKLVTRVGRVLGIGCYFIGTVVRSKSLRALGLPSIAERNFRRKNYDSACVRALELLQLVEADPNDWNYGNAVHYAHLMLGRVAVVRGDLERAEAELRSGTCSWITAACFIWAKHAARSRAAPSWSQGMCT